LHVTGKSVGGTSFVLTMWGLDAVSGEWAILTDYGTAGVKTITTAGVNVDRDPPVLLAGIERVYPQISTNTGATADVWLSVASFD
jgi:hypothetical protein